MPLGWLVFLGLLCALGTLGNLLIIGAVAVSKRLRKQSNAFVVNLALADIVITCYIMPVGLASAYFKQNPFSQTMCDINAFLIMTTCGVSTQSLMLVALERYFHICQTAYYNRIFKRSTIAVFVVLCWVYTMAWTFHGWTGWTRYVYGNDVYVCLFDGPYSLSYDICLVLFGMAIPMFILAFCYTAIFRKVHQSNVRLASHRRRYGLHNASTDSLNNSDSILKKELQFVITLFAIVVAFVILWLPATIVLPMTGSWKGMPKVFYTISVWLALCNSCVNSLIYGILNKNFRRGYLHLLTVCCCRGRPNACDCSQKLLPYRDSSHNSVNTSRVNTRSPSTPANHTTRMMRLNAIDETPDINNTSRTRTISSDSEFCHSINSEAGMTHLHISSDKASDVKRNSTNGIVAAEDIRNMCTTIDEVDTNIDDVRPLPNNLHVDNYTRPSSRESRMTASIVNSESDATHV